MATAIREYNMLQQFDWSYSDFDQFMSLYSDCRKNSSIFHLNIRSFNRNSDNLFLFLSKLPHLPAVIVLTETWFTDDNVSEIDGYSGFHVYRGHKRGGGVSIFVKMAYRAVKVIDGSFVDGHIEICTVKFKVNESEVIIMGTYRPPDGSIERYVEFLDPMLSRVNPRNQVFLLGDMNIDLIDPCPQSVDFINYCYASAFVPLISMPTHVTPQSSTCIDHIWSNQIGAGSGVFPVDISDHYVIFAVLDFDVNRNDVLKKRFRDHSEHSLNNLRTGLSLFCNELNDCSDDLESRTDRFIDGFLGIYNECCKVRTKSMSRRKYLKPWITNSIMKCVTRKYDLFKQYKMNQIPYERYNSFKNVLTSILRRAKIRYYSNKFDACIGDIKKTWHLANSLVKPKIVKTANIELEIDDCVISDQNDVARRFNNYFSSVAVDLDRKIPNTDTCPLSYVGEPTTPSMFVQPVTIRDVKDVISGLANRPNGVSDVPPFIYKYCSNIIAPTIANLFNQSINVGVFPSKLKLARIVPVHKGGNNSSLNNYRPISTLSILSKIFEKLMFGRLQSFISANELICNNQFGFKRGSSTSDAVAEFLNCAYESLDRKGVMISVFLDFSKAFDTVNHGILLLKMNRLGIRGVVNDWFKSYLTERKQYVYLNNCASPVTTMRLGVPQGSVLGPILFLLYVNDMSHSSNLLKLVHFADDTTAVFSARNIDEAVGVVNNELIKLSEWLSANRLSLNIGKTCYMVLTDKKGVLPGVNIDGKAIDRVATAKFLGITLDEGLTFTPHVEHVCKRVSSATGMLNRVSFLIPVNVRLKIYYAMIYSRVSYGVITWGRCNLTSIARLSKTLTRAKKSLQCNREIGSGLLTFDSIYRFFSAVKMFKVVKFDQHPYFSGIYSTLEPSHEYNTRFSFSNYNLPQVSKTKCQRGFLFQSVDIWNNLPNFLKECQTVVKFKYLLKIHLISLQNV